MSTIIKAVSFKTIEIPLRELFLIATAVKKAMKNIVVRLELENGIVGFGEVSPLFSTHESDYGGMIGLLREASTQLIGRDINDCRSFITRIRSKYSDVHFALSGLEIAIYDALSRLHAMPLYRFFGGKRTELETDMTIGICSREDTIRLTENFLAQGFRKIKMKVGLDVAADIERMIAVTNAAERFLTKAVMPAPPQPFEIYLDANQGYTLTEAQTVLKAIEQKGLPVTLFEQPLPKDDLAGLQQLTSISVVPIAADESVASLGDAIKVIETRSAHVINIKLAKTGILASLDIITAARDAGLKLMIGGMLESKIGIAASVHLACGSHAFTYHDLDTIYLLSDYEVEGGFECQGPIYSVKNIKAGTGISVNFEDTDCS
jgi:L-alanine-DL-glutamate epimerase-like enolase superfamily enzyme